MPRRKYDTRNSNDDTFETDTFSFLNSGDPREETKHDDDDDVDLDSDNDAPEEVGFHDSKQTVMDQIKSALQQVDSERKKKKELRKKIDEQYKEQKAKKLEQLAKSKLPEDILEGIEDSIPAKKKKLDKTKKKKKKVKSDDAVDDVEDDCADESTNEAATHLAEQASEDFIGFTDRESGIVVADVKAVERQTKSVGKTAADFRQSRLYGGHVRRESNKDRLAAMEKRRQRMR